MDFFELEKQPYLWAAGHTSDWGVESLTRIVPSVFAIHANPVTPTTCATYQISANVLLGRSHIGVHWRMDGVNGATMGQTSAIRRLQQVRQTAGRPLRFSCTQLAKRY